MEVYDHDFNTFSAEVVIPHGIYDIKRNTGYITLGTSKDTSEFYCECIKDWWMEYGIEIRMAHYPPYTSKYNPIEHRLFCYVTSACKGAVFSSIDVVKSLVDKTSTSTGLKVFMSIKDKVYATAKKVSEGFKENIAIVFDDYLGKWNYKVIYTHREYEVIF